MAEINGMSRTTLKLMMFPCLVGIITKECIIDAFLWDEGFGSDHGGVTGLEIGFARFPQHILTLSKNIQG